MCPYAIHINGEERKMLGFDKLSTLNSQLCEAPASQNGGKFMKTKLTRISKRSLSMLLAVLMMFSVLGFGTLITTNAADVDKAESGWAATYSDKSKYYVHAQIATSGGGWSSEYHDFYFNSDGRAWIELTKNYGYNLVLVNSIDGYWYKHENGSQMTQGNTYYMKTSGTESQIKPSTDSGMYLFTLTGLYDDDGTRPKTLAYNYAKATSYTISYNKGTNGTGTNTTDTKYQYKDITLKGSTFTRTGYTQDGWSTTDGGDKTYDLSASYADNSGLTLYPHWKANTYSITYNGNGNTGGSTSVGTKTYGVNYTIASNGFTKTGYNFDKWNTESNGSGTSYAEGATYTTNGALTLYAQWAPKTSTLSFNTMSATTDGTQTASASAIYDSDMPSFTTYTAPTKTGYSLDGWYDAATNGTKYYNADGTSAKNWDKDTTSSTTLYAHWIEVKAGATVKAYTNNSASSTGGTVKIGTSGTASGTATTSDSFGIDTASPAIIKASTATGYEFKGWQFNSTHLKYSFDGTTYNAVTNTSTTYGTSSNDTVYLKTDGTSGMTTANTEVHAMFESAKYTITYSGKYTNDGAAWNNISATQGTFTVTNNSDSGTNVASGSTVAYQNKLTVTATPAEGYVCDGIYYKTTSDGTWSKMETDTNTSTGAVYNNNFNVESNWYFKANFIKVYKLSAFDSYEKTGNTDNDVHFITAPPKSITVKHTGADGVVTTYTYAYDGTLPKGNADTTTEGCTHPAALAIKSASYGAGNYIQYYAGDEITMTYSAMATSELIKGVFYNNGVNYEIIKPTAKQFVSHDYDAEHTIYMASTYYTAEQLGAKSFTGVTVDQDVHSVKFTGTKDYKNIDIEIATKRRIYFSDYTNAVISSKNMDDYYYDNEAISVEGDQLTVAAATSATQTNSIVGSGVKFYKANSDGSKGDELTSTEKTELDLSITNATSTSTSSANGRALVISGNMPAYNLYIDLNLTSTYTLKAASKLVSDLGNGSLYLKQKATTVTVGSLPAPSNAYVSSTTTSVSKGSSVTLTVSGIASGYMFVGWYWGNSDDSAPDYQKGYISDKETFSYTPRKGGTIWAVGTRDLFINGSAGITGKTYASGVYWNQDSGGTWQNLQMSFDGASSRYYWEITDTMFSAAGSNFKTWQESNTDLTDAYGQYYTQNSKYYWYNSDEKYHGKAYFQFLDTATGSDSKSIWNYLTSFKVDNPANGPTYGKIYPLHSTDSNGQWNGQGFINFNETDYNGYSSPLRIYYDPNASGNARLSVEATPIYSDVYVSNGFDVGSTLKSDAVTVEPVVVNGDTHTVVSSGQTGFFNVNGTTTYNPDAEGQVKKYSPQKKGATIRITKKAGGSDKIAAFLIYDLDAKTVHAEKDISTGTTAGGKTPYYFDLTLANEKQRLYIVPIVEEDGAKVTITFDATQLNRSQWGDIVTAYAWYKTTNGPALGAYPGQPMIPSADMSTWTTSFNPIKNDNEIAGITFSNYVDGRHSWLGCTTDNGGVPSGETNVMGSESNSGKQSISTSGGIITQYNIMKDTDYRNGAYQGTYNKANFKAQTYDYHEPIALYDRYKNEDSIDITFQMKDGNSSLISWRHSNLILENEIGSGENILNLPSGWTPLRWEYLTNAKGDQYVDMNGKTLGANNKPTATFYVASKGMVVYNNSTMDYVFHGSHNYEMKDYQATYNDPNNSDRGTYTRTAQANYWTKDITYGGASDLDMKYGVQWYVYDAQGNYITTVLSAGIADLSSNDVDTYIGKQLEDMGYAVDGKSVAICYDKPRYMYGDWTGVANSANSINCGPNFDAYRFEGQWIAAASSDTTKVNVEVAMMTDSGEVLANSRSAGYGHAEAALVDGVTFTKRDYATAATDGSWAQTATSDAKLNGIQLTASEQNFIGWYYYDANTGEFTKATYTSHTGFRPSYSTKDVTFYAVYRASAIYQFLYQGRESMKTYSVAGNDLTPTEMQVGENQNKVQYENHSSDIISKVPVGIGIFKKDIVFSSETVGSSIKDNSLPYILNLSGFVTTSPTYTLTAYYKNASGNPVTITKSATYNSDDSVVDLTSGVFIDSNSQTKPAGTAVTSYYSTGNHRFIGWYEYDGNTVGDLLSTQANYGMRLTRNQAIIAVYGEETHPDPGSDWHVSIDENEVNKELTTKDSGVFYNDTIVRVRKGSDVKATLPDGYRIGVLVVCDNKTGYTINEYNQDQLTTLAGSVSSGTTRKTGKGLSITNLQSVKTVNDVEQSVQTNFNRTDLAVRADYAISVGAKYCVYAYLYNGSTYTFSTVSAVKEYK